jgi:hypothetical protein
MAKTILRRCQAAHSRPIPAVVQAEADKGFRSLEGRLVAIRNKVKLAAQQFGDFVGIPEEYIPASAVVQEAAEELDRLWHDMDVWDVRLNGGLRTRLESGMSLKKALAPGEVSS